VQTWDIRTLDVEPHRPQVLHSDDEGRTIVINLPAGEELQDHQVHERAWILVVDGEVEIEAAGGTKVSGSTGLLALTEPKERHEVRAISDARLVLVLAPWPGPGHPSETAQRAEA
jgi:quercetin dioxygenase-like cupin family protein